jgi:hypothetical protein
MRCMALHWFATGFTRGGPAGPSPRGLGRWGFPHLVLVVAAAAASAACGGQAEWEGGPAAEADEPMPYSSGTLITWGSTGVIYGPEAGNLRLLDNVLGELEASVTDERAGRILYTSACDPRESPTFCAASSDWSDLEGFFATVARHGEIDFQPISVVQPASYAMVILDACSAFGGWADLAGSARKDAEVMRSYIRGGGSALVLADNFCGDGVESSAQRANEILDGLGVRFLDVDPPEPKLHPVASVERVGLLAGVEEVDIFRTVPQTLEPPFEPILSTVNGVLMARRHVP